MRVSLKKGACGNSSNAKLVADRVCRLIDMKNAKLSCEFFPAHLSVALIDVIFNPQLDYCKQVVPIIERYCQHFDLDRFRQDKKNLPAIEEQETLDDLITHYKKYGKDGMREKVFLSNFRSPGTEIFKSDNVCCAARALQKIGINTLQDACRMSKDPDGIEKIKCALLQLRGIGERTVHMFLMYSGNDDFVKGDVHVRRFVADALSVKKASAENAECLVRKAARILDVFPRLLDYKIWEYQAYKKRKQSSCR